MARRYPLLGTLAAGRAIQTNRRRVVRRNALTDVERRAMAEAERAHRIGHEQCHHCLAYVPSPAFARGAEHLTGCPRFLAPSRRRRRNTPKRRRLARSRRRVARRKPARSARRNPPPWLLVANPSTATARAAAAKWAQFQGRGTRPAKPEQHRVGGGGGHMHLVVLGRAIEIRRRGAPTMRFGAGWQMATTPRGDVLYFFRRPADLVGGRGAVDDGAVSHVVYDGLRASTSKRNVRWVHRCGTGVRVFHIGRGAYAVRGGRLRATTWLHG